MDIQILASGSTGNCYRISDGNTALLIECGVPITQIKKALNYKIRDIAGCIISHEHGDHSKACKSLAKWLIPLYMTEGTLAALKLYEGEIETIESFVSFPVGSFVIIPFDVSHDATEPVGFYIRSIAAGENLLYITDTSHVEHTFSGLTHIMIECNYTRDVLEGNAGAGKINPALARRIKKTHFSLENVKKCLKANDLSKVRSIHILHTSSSNADIPKIKKEIQEITGKEVIIC